jgi:ATP-dependent metalloprotease FtsH
MSNADKRRRKRSRGSGRSHLGLYSVLAVIVLLGAYVAVLAYSKPQVGGDALRLDTFVRYIGANRIKDARVLDEDSVITGDYVRDDKTVGPYNAPYLKTSGSQETLVDQLVRKRVPTTIDQQFSKKLIFPATILIPSLIVIVVFVYLLLSYRRGTGLFGVKSGARKWDADAPQVTFADVAGQEAAIDELRELVGFLTEPERFAELGALIPRGILLYGPPGCGKTLIARALAGESGASFYSISGSDFVEMYVGVGAARVRDLFREARENAPAIVFIDELDSVGHRRGGGVAAAGSSGEHEQTLNQILAEMDGFSPLEGIVLIGATNRPDVLDPALLRPGRFDRAVGLERPGEADRLKIVQLHANTRARAADADLPAIAARAHGLTGADLANVVNEAALLAAQHRKPAIGQEELEAGLARIMEAPERQRRLSMRDRSVGRKSGGADKRVTFADVAGQDVAKADLRELVDFLAEPKRFTDIGARMPKGVLLFGPPGCGKTLLARAVAGEANATFISVAASEFVEVLVGEGAARMRDLFAEAKMSAPAIVFVDEIDALGSRRSQRASGGSQESEQTLNQLLVELDGFDPSSGVLLMAATNRPDMLDPALLRPGRFDRTVGLERPAEADRLAILRLHAAAMTMAPGADLAVIAAKAHGLTGADLAGVVNEAGLLAARAGRSDISQPELEAGLARIMEAPERQRRLAARARSVGRRSSGIDERVTFADVAGVGDALDELREIRDYLAEPERFAQIGARVPSGVMLNGPPGCGKTLLAKAVAGEANAAFISAAATDFVEVYVGEGAARIRDLFAEARAVAPAIVFIDEIDALGRRRETNALGGSQEREQTLNALLVELDGFEARSGVLLMCATNRPDILDPALVRPGRIDRHIEIMLPDRRGRQEILELHLRGKPLAGDVDVAGIAAMSPGFAGADLANIVNEAALLATRAGSSRITAASLEEAVERVVLGLASHRSILSEEERRVTAYHEAGHALVGLTLPGTSVPHKISIIPRGRVLGFVWNTSDEDRVTHSRTMLINHMAKGLGGRVAEELVFGEPSSGASDDLARVTATARRMVCELGMGEATGAMSFTAETYSNGPPGMPGYSSAQVELVGIEMRRLVDEALRLATDVLRTSRPALDRIAAELLEQETVSAARLKQLVAGAAVGSADA